jgi:hypothetical protein
LWSVTIRRIRTKEQRLDLDTVELGQIVGQHHVVPANLVNPAVELADGRVRRGGLV